MQFPALLSGKIELPNNMIISYCSQDTSMLYGTIQEYAKEREIDLTLFMTLAGTLSSPLFFHNIAFTIV